MTKRRTAAEIIAFHFGWDMREVSETRYQPTRYTAPAVYVLSDDYYAAPADNRPPKYELGEPWQFVAEYYGRKIFVSKLEGSGTPPKDSPVEPTATDKFAKTVEGIGRRNELSKAAIAAARPEPNFWFQSEEGIRLHFETERHSEQARHEAKLESLRTEEQQFIYALRNSTAR